MWPFTQKRNNSIYQRIANLINYGIEESFTGEQISKMSVKEFFDLNYSLGYELRFSRGTVL